MCLQKLKVLFAVGSDGEVSEPLEVSALSCDTVEQVKEKILATFKAKFGFSFSPNLRELWIGKVSPGLQVCIISCFDFINKKIISMKNKVKLFFFFYQNMRKMARLCLYKRWTPAPRSSGR